MYLTVCINTSGTPLDTLDPVFAVRCCMVSECWLTRYELLEPYNNCSILMMEEQLELSS
jgi:hypothetical protein